MNCQSCNTSNVVISRVTERFVNEIHDHKEELRSSDELLTASDKSERREPYGEKRGSKSIKQTCAPKGNKETCANPLSNPIINSLFTKREPLLLNMFLHLFGGNGL